MKEDPTNTPPSEADPLDLIVPESIPGALFRRVADKLHDFYPASKRKAERAAVAVLEESIKYYEAVLAEEEGQ